MGTARSKSHARCATRAAATSALPAYARRVSCARPACATHLSAGRLSRRRGGGHRRPRPHSIRVRRGALIAPLGRAAEAQARAQFPVHLKVDSGATRLGILPGELDPQIAELWPRAIADGRGCMHLAGQCRRSSKPRDRSAQLEVFNAALARLRAAGIIHAVAHVANSAASILRPDAHYSLLRPGLAIYGLPPVPAVRERSSCGP